MQSTAQARSAPCAPASAVLSGYPLSAHFDPSAAGSAFLLPGARVKSECAYAGLSRTGRFLPTDPLMTPPFRPAGPPVPMTGVTVTLLIFPPRDSIRRRASP